MATVVQLPKVKSFGEALGEGAGVGLSNYLTARRERQRKEALLKGLTQLEDAIAGSSSVDEALKINPFKYIDAGSLSSDEQLAAINSFAQSRIKAFFPETEQLVNTQGQPQGVGAGGRRPTGSQLFTTKEFADVQTGLARRATAEKESKFTLSDRKLQILVKMSQNEAAGLPREHGLQRSDIEFVASELADPMIGPALKVITESRIYPRLKTEDERIQFFQDVMTAMRLSRQQKPVPAKVRQRLGADANKVIDVTTQSGKPNERRGVIQQTPAPAAQPQAAPTAQVLPGATQPAGTQGTTGPGVPPARLELPPEAVNLGITPAEVQANLEALQKEDPSVTTQEVVAALIKRAKGKLGGR